MKRLFCRCGNQVFFDSQQCLHCGARLGFDSDQLIMRALTCGDGDSGRLGEHCETVDGEPFRHCGNRVDFDVCNWLVPQHSDQRLCFACQFNRTVPNQSLPGNQQRWRVLEEGKKRLFFTLMRLGLPLVSGWRDPGGLLLDFVEDGRSREEYAETFASTGYLGGVITINTLEADSVARAAAREQLNERYRTVLGHLRHESGHYYWAHLNPDAALRSEFTDLFGDEREDYASALSRHYAQGPPPNWRERYISAYASAHPSEDWAETWGHYLHIYDALETAAAHDVIPWGPDALDMDGRIAQWRELSLALNELNRSVGHGDAYPFVINSEVERKLAFADRVIARLQTPQ
ncbi:zinc-binding metallopeptidase family protein [Parahaliea mediterranea]|uniref:zinc-binding metallopeptidase family protein n=1 Tax=Parahaliea mediterranea TaxID=651086 RepID=UPI000E2F078C|nr:putative zinc-binding metallopeptidase [Parahaliea mediterranea]